MSFTTLLQKPLENQEASSGNEGRNLEGIKRRKNFFPKFSTVNFKTQTPGEGKEARGFAGEVRILPNHFLKSFLCYKFKKLEFFLLTISFQAKEIFLQKDGQLKPNVDCFCLKVDLKAYRAS